jgi:hypothetical protein
MTYFVFPFEGDLETLPSMPNLVSTPMPGPTFYANTLPSDSESKGESETWGTTLEEIKERALFEERQAQVKEELLSVVSNPILLSEVTPTSPTTSAYIDTYIRHLVKRHRGGENLSLSLYSILVEKMADTTMGGVSVAYRSFFRIIASLFSLDDDLHLVRCEQLLLPVIRRCQDVMTNRRRKGDGEFCYAINKLILSLFIKNPDIASFFSKDIVVNRSRVRGGLMVSEVKAMRVQWKQKKEEDEKRRKKQRGGGMFDFMGTTPRPFGL